MSDLNALRRALGGAVDVSVATSDEVLATLDAASEVFGEGAAELRRRRNDAGRLYGGLEEALATAERAFGDARRHVEDRRANLGEFRVAMFGRTSVGKSSLIEALTRGDAATVSPGQGDHTEDIREVRWGPLLVVDMPGTLGAGRRLSREELEARAEAEVRRADLVLLVFDSQNQQDAEFERAAEMVLEYRKPVIAVLNVRNSNWRSPDSSVTSRRRNKRDLAVQQQVTHLDHELADIGVHACPIVAINTLRATFARCEPYHAPDFEPARDRQVAQYGKQLLEVSSNVAVLEEAVIATVQQRCVGLRRAALLGDLPAGLGHVQAAFADLPDSVKPIGTVERLLRDLGYPQPARGTGEELSASPVPPSCLLEDPALDLGPLEVAAVGRAAERSVHASDGVLDAAVCTRAGNELALLERVRGVPFDAATRGTAHRYVDRAMTVAFTSLRLEAHRRAEELVLGATRDTTVNFGEAVIDVPRLTEAADAAVAGLVRDLCEMVDLGARQVAAGLTIDDETLLVRTGGRAERFGSIIARVGSVSTSGALVVAATNFWNPGGWAAFGLAVGGFIASRLGGRLSRRSEQKRLSARAASIADARRMVDATFDTVEADARRVVWASMTTIAAALLVPLLRGATDLQLVKNLADELAAVEQPDAGPAVTHASLPSANVLQGARWRPPHIDEREEPAAPADPEHFSALAWTPIAVPAEASLDAAVRELRRLVDELGLGYVAERLDDVARAPTRIALCGDYSSAKSSLRAVLTRTSPASRRGVKRGADRTTTRVETGRFGTAVLVDTPGFGSPEPRDAELVECAIEDASLVLHLVTPRLIAALPHRVLDRLAEPSARGEVARQRTRFVLTRIDELGVLPDEAPDAFVTLVQNKREELARILARKGVPIDADDVLVVAPDPFGADFDDEVLRRSAGWSGVDRLRAELREFAEDRRARVAGVLAAGLARLDKERARIAATRDADEAGAREGAAFAATARRAARDTSRLADELTERLRRAVAPVLHEVVVAVLATQGDAQKVALDRARTWWDDPRITIVADRWQRQAASAVREHADRVNGELQRQLDARPAFSGRSAAAMEGIASPQDGSNVRDAGRAASRAGSALHSLDNVKVLKIRDALRKLPLPADKLKFKPWGAHNLAKRAQLVGKGAAVAGLVLEVIAITADERSKTKQERLRTEVRQRVLAAADDWIRALTDGDDDAPGPATTLGALATAIGALGDVAADEVQRLEERIVFAAEQLNSIDNHTGRTT